MRIPRVLLTDPDLTQDRIELPAEEARHLVTVLRRGPGDRVLLVSGRGDPVEAEIISVEKGRVGVRVLGAAPAGSAGPPVLEWSLGVAIVKGEAFELALRFASELGVRELVPMLTERTVVRISGDSRRPARWRRIAREAAKQCGRSVPLEVREPSSFQELVACPEPLSSGSVGEPSRWILCPPAGVRAGSWAGVGPPAGEPAWFLIGPEGGFSPEEVALAQAAGWVPVGLPTPILRTPTAVAVVGALGVLSPRGEAPQSARPRPGPASADSR